MPKEKSPTELPAQAPKATPENTPPPGGGRYRWDIAKPGWVDLDAAPDADLVALPELPES